MEEIAGWMLEGLQTQQGSRELQEVIEKESGKDARRGDDSMDGLDGSLSS